MNRRIAKTTYKDSKQPKLTAFITNKSNETSSGTMKDRKILMNVFLNVNLKSRIGKRNTKTICLVSAGPETDTSSISNDAHSSVVFGESGTIDSATVNVNVTLNVTTDTEVAGKCRINVFC